MFFSFQTVYSRKLQISAETNLPQALTDAVWLVHVVERKMHHACQTFGQFVNSTKSLIFYLMKILLPKHLVHTYSLIAKVMYYQILFAELN